MKKVRSTIWARSAVTLAWRMKSTTAAGSSACRRSLQKTVSLPCFTPPTRMVGALQDLNSLVGPSDWKLNSATDINDAGQITGWGTIDGQTRAYLYDSGSVQALDVLPGYDFSIGRGINAAGDVVGYSATGEITDPLHATDEPFFWFLTSSGEDRAFLFRDGAMHDLNSLIDPASGWTILGATDINDSGQIVGWGTLAGEDPTRVHALLLTPVPEPSGWLLAGVGVLAIAAWHTMRRRDP